MTTQTSAVGATTLPIPAGAVGDKLADPIVEGLLDFLAWCLNNDLNAKLANLNGTSEQAVPSGHAYPFDPTEPQGHKARFRLPALFVWWPGRSAIKPYSQLLDMRERAINALYIFQELPQRAALELRSGLFAAVDASFAKAASRGYHPDYSYGDVAPGTELDKSIGGACTWEWSYVGGQGIQRIGIGDTNTTNFGDRNPSERDAGRRFPAFAGSFSVRELVEREQPDDANRTQDSQILISNAGVPILDRVLEAPDGSRAPPEV